MSWKVEVKPRAEKQYLRLGKKTRERVRKALEALEGEENPLFHSDVRPLSGELKGDYRLRVGDWRVLFPPDKKKKVLYVYAVLPRGDAY
ncbi:MAG TPA: type II toxin-antitoxin system RelE/ParE family toxin [Thermodesulfobacteriota bacterium]|nr:type II toxin-antitoxin system RelE/ParE family toxin [Thermodesulfobacteriota bacterium]